MSIEQLKVDLQAAIQQAEHKPGEWSQTAQSMGGICCPGEKFQIGKPWPKESPWAQFSYKRDSWLAVAAVNALPEMLAEIERLTDQNESLLECRSAVNGAVALENEALRKDSERYRWLRDVAGYCDTRDIPGMAPARMDAFIDAALAKERGQ